MSTMSYERMIKTLDECKAELQNVLNAFGDENNAEILYSLLTAQTHLSNGIGELEHVLASGGDTK